MLRFWIPISCLAVVGIVISAAVALRIYQQEITLERRQFEYAIDAHVVRVQERLAEREVLARVAAAMFTPPATIVRDSLQVLQISLKSLKADFVAVGWLPRIEPAQADAALRVLAETGITSPQILGPGSQPIDASRLERPLYPVIDVEPRTAENLRVLGVDAAAVPQYKAALDAASATRQLFATDPVPLIQWPGTLGIILYTPVYRPGQDQPAGFITFAYRLDQTIARVGDVLRFSVAFADPAAPSPRSLLRIDADGRASDGATAAAIDQDNSEARELQFGTRRWTLHYQPANEPGERAAMLAVNAGAIGLALTSILVGLFGYVVHNNIRLSREAELRTGVEQRLNAVIRELNHRVMNMLAVIQSIVVRSLQSGAVVDEARDRVIGRLHAMSHAVALLTETEWRGINLRDLFSSKVMPATANMTCEGPDIIIGARAAQAISLLFHELASNAQTDGALVSPSGNVIVRWSVSEGAKPVFRLRWEETGGSPPEGREGSDFGTIVLDRVAPEAISGTARRSLTATGFVYELEAPLWGLGDKGRAED